MIDYYRSPLGWLEIKKENGELTSLEFVKREGVRTGDLRDVKEALREYFKGQRKHFNQPINPKGTKFEAKVWKYLTRVPYGTVVSYSELSKMIGHPKAYRAVGNALHKNPIVFIIPCHRVVGRNGLGGFSSGILKKKKLLKLEKCHSSFIS